MWGAEVHYIEKIYNRREDDINDGIEICRVNSRDPLAVEEEKGLVGFRFFDVDVDRYQNWDVVNFGYAKNYSGMYYFGKRLTYRELFSQALKDPIKSLQLDYLNRCGVEEAIFCEASGKIISHINEDDRTIDEVKVALVEEQASSIFITHQQFFNTIASSIEEHERKNESFVDVIVSGSVCPLCEMEIPDVDSMSAIIRTYDFYVGENKEFSSSTIIPGDKIGNLGQETYFSLREALDIINPLYQDYPYLEEAIYDFKLSFADEKTGPNSVSVNKALSKSDKKASV